jgi:hypothetical protein
MKFNENGGRYLESRNHLIATPDVRDLHTRNITIDQCATRTYQGPQDTAATNRHFIPCQGARLIRGQKSQCPEGFNTLQIFHQHLTSNPLGGTGTKEWEDYC